MLDKHEKSQQHDAMLTLNKTDEDTADVLGQNVEPSVLPFNILRLATQYQHQRSPELRFAAGIIDPTNPKELDKFLSLLRGPAPAETVTLHTGSAAVSAEPIPTNHTHHVHMLDLSRVGANYVTDNMVFRFVQACPNLKHINLSACFNISNNSITKITNCCKSLEHLDISYQYTMEPDDTLSSAWSTEPTLRTKYNYTLTFAAVSDLAKQCRTLEFLNISDTFETCGSDETMQLTKEGSDKLVIKMGGRNFPEPSNTTPGHVNALQQQREQGSTLKR